VNIREATRSYEDWLASKIAVVKGDLDYKHEQMAAAAFRFLRATYYRWLQLWPQVCPDLAKAPQVLAVGDLHVENFGTWRDTEGRLIWGVNDFDEAYPESYAIDLVRLAASARLAGDENELRIKPEDACEMILEGYSKSLQSGGEPFVLAEKHKWLRDLALNDLRDPVQFWKKMEDLPAAAATVPASAPKLLEDLLPERGLDSRLKRRRAGLGSLGRQRILALAQWRGGYVAREAKSLLPSAHVWAAGPKAEPKIWYQAILEQSVRVRDPYVTARADWILRRLAPDCSRIELASLPKEHDEARLLRAMGAETANIHLGTKGAAAQNQQDLKKRSGDWLFQASKDMAKAVKQDWDQWRKP